MKSKVHYSYSNAGNASRLFCLLLLLSYLILGCSWAREDRILSRPTITEGTAWKMEQGCGYERCGGPLVDFLVRKDLKIRIEAHNDEKDGTFAILVAFLARDKLEIEFNPSLVSVELANDKLLLAKGFPCSGRIWDPSYRKSISPISSPTFVDKYNCFLLFFDSPPPKIEEEFKMRINGVIVGGQPLTVPEITFRKGVSRW